jgi:Flp pilus assembly protein TadB
MQSRVRDRVLVAFAIPFIAAAVTLLGDRYLRSLPMWLMLVIAAACCCLIAAIAVYSRRRSRRAPDFPG